MIALIGQTIETVATVASFVFPIPTTNIQIFWSLLGAQFGRSFGKQLDQGIQAGDTFQGLTDWQKDIVKRILDFTHHWWVGGFLWLYATEINNLMIDGGTGFIIPLTFFGFGLMVDDMRDIENLKRRFNGKPDDDQ